MSKTLIDLLPITLRLRKDSRRYRLLRFPLRRSFDYGYVRRSRVVWGAPSFEEAERTGWVLTPLGLLNSTPLGVCVHIKIKD